MEHRYERVHGYKSYRCMVSIISEVDDTDWLTLNKSQILSFYLCNSSDQWASVCMCVCLCMSLPPLISLCPSLKRNSPFSWLKVSIWFWKPLVTYWFVKGRRRKWKRMTEGPKRNTFPLLYPGQTPRKKKAAMHWVIFRDWKWTSLGVLVWKWSGYSLCA